MATSLLAHLGRADRLSFVSAIRGLAAAPRRWSARQLLTDAVEKVIEIIDES
jgi:hypothetical protein